MPSSRGPDVRDSMHFASVLLQRDPAPGGPVYTIIAVVVLVVDIMVIISIWKSHKALLPKVVWTLVIVFTSVIGWILYFILGREK
jgi:hypothetical protein